MAGMATFTLTIDLDGDAFQDNDNGELIRLIRKTASVIEQGATEAPVLDTNGNTCGKWSLREGLIG